MPELVVGQAGKELTHNQALAVLDQLAQAVVVDKDLTAPPGSPENGSMYIVAAGATGAWAGQSGKLAYWLTTVAAWTFITTADGWSVWVTDEAVRYERKDGAWVEQTGGGTGMSNPMTTAGDLIVGGAAGVPARLAAGTNAYVLTMVAGAPVWGPPSGAAFTGGTLTSALNEAPPVTLASAGTVPIGAASANSITISGTTTVTAFDTIAAGAVRHLVFTGVLTLTHNATSLILPTAANLTTAPGDAATFESLGSGNWRCTGYLRSSGAALSGGGGGGLSNLAETKNTASPNTTIPVVALSVTITEVSGDFAIVPKGAAGSLLAAVPDNTVTGGIRRGSKCIDLQLSRANPNQVASGEYSVLVGGSENRATGNYCAATGGRTNLCQGDYSAIFGGWGNTTNAQFASVWGGDTSQATGTSSAVVGGSSNLASGTNAFIGGGQTNTASGLNSSVVSGRNNTAGGSYSSICGGWYATTRSIYGAEARASGQFGQTGDAQRERFIMRKATTDATASPVSADGGAASASNQVVLPNNGTFDFSARVVARSGDDQASFSVTGLITRGSGVATTTIVGAPAVTATAKSGGASAWGISVSANTTLGCLTLTVTGVAATNIKWVADIETVEVVG